jgi:hypothetical protein
MTKLNIAFASILLLLLGACHPQPEGSNHSRSSVDSVSQNKTPKIMDTQDGLEAKLLTSSQGFPASDIDQFELGVRITNHGKEAVEPEAHLFELLVNGKPSMEFSLAISNGKREEKWFVLPPGESVEFTWKTMGPSLFTGSGEYKLELRTPFGNPVPLVVKVY